LSRARRLVAIPVSVPRQILAIVMGLPPIYAGHDQRIVDSILILHGNFQKRIEQRVRKQVRLQAKIGQLGVFRVVVVFLRFDARVGEMRYFDVQADMCRGFLNDAGKF